MEAVAANDAMALRRNLDSSRSPSGPIHSSEEADTPNDLDATSSSALNSHVQPMERPGKAEPLLAELKVILVEDDFDTLDLVETILCGYGAQVASATDVKGAISLVEAWNPDVLLSDIGLPDEDGISLIRYLRSRGRTAGLCAVAMSAYGSREHVKSALLAGFHAYITKPFDAFHLAEVVSNIVRQRSTHNEERHEDGPIARRA